MRNLGFEAKKGAFQSQVDSDGETRCDVKTVVISKATIWGGDVVLKAEVFENEVGTGRTTSEMDFSEYFRRN